MKRHLLRTVSSFALYAFLASAAFADDGFDSYVTRTGSAQEFDLGGKHVRCLADTTTFDAATGIGRAECRQHRFGQRLVVEGKFDKASGAIAARKIEEIDNETGRTIDGSALIDAVLAPNIVRADGHAIVIDSKTKITRTPPMDPNAAPAPHQWVRYSGVRREDGAIVAREVTLASIEVGKDEQKLRDRNEFDAAANTEGNKQGAMSKFFMGTNYKKIPASKNSAMQERVNRIGMRLVPAFQKRLEDADPRKLNFRFQVVEKNKYTVVPFPNGIILVNEHAVAMMQNDDQVAALLAEGIADVLERNWYRYLPGTHAMTAAQIAGNVGSLIIPGLGIATALGNSAVSSKIGKRLAEQDLRLSLVLMHDAGYDVAQAALADWHAEVEKDDFMARPAPHFTAYLFQTLATDWGPDSPLHTSVADVK